MEYVRVKDMSWEWITTSSDYVNARNKATELGLTYSAKIVKQSDNLEKLCDELYFVEDETNIPLTVNRLHDFDEDTKLTECCLEIGGWITWLSNYSKKGCIKGALFTSKGIIYATKMNDNGDFELL